MVTEAEAKQVSRVERKTKQKWMTEDVLELIEKRRLVKMNREKYEKLNKETRKKCDKAM